MSFDSDFKLTTANPGSEPPSLTDVNAEEEEEEQPKKSSVKFADLNDIEQLEKQYEEVMEEIPPPATNDDDSSFEPDLTDAAAAAKEAADEVIEDVAVAVKEVPEQIQDPALGLPTIAEDEGERKGGQNPQIMEPTNMELTAPVAVPAGGGGQKRLSLAEQIENQEITPDDIFNEIKIARNSLPGSSGPEPVQNLHSYIISKTYSSENVVVLLNLRRMKDGDWVLDKTIAQGLKPETYGGVVSIDKYDFSEHAIQISRVSSSQALPSRTCDKDKDMSEMLKRIEAYIASVNEKVDNINLSCSIEPGTSNPEPSPKPAQSCNFTASTIPYKDMSLLDKLIGMLNALAPEDTQPCSICEEYNMDTGSAISSWLHELIADTFSFFPGGGGGGGCTAAAVSAALLSKSKELLDNADAQTAALMAESKDLLDKVATRKSALLSESIALLQQVQEEESAEETPTEPEAEVDSEPPALDKSEPEEPPPEAPPEEPETPPPPEPIPPLPEAPEETPPEIPEPFPPEEPEPPPLEESAINLDDDSSSYQINIEPETDPEEFVEKHQ